MFCFRGRGTAVSLAYNPIENAAIVLSRPRDADSASVTSSTLSTPVNLVYDLYMLPRDTSSSGSEPLQHTDSRSGTGCAVAWVGRNRFAVLESAGTVSYSVVHILSQAVCHKMIFHATCHM